MKGKSVFVFSSILIVSFIMVMSFSFPLFLNTAVASENELVVGIPEDRCPLFYIDKDTGETVGIGVDLMRAAAEEAGYVAIFKTITEDSLKEALDNPEYDVLMPFGSSITSAEGKKIIVSENIMQTPFTLVTGGKVSLPPLNELKIGMISSLAGGAETIKELYPGMEIFFYEDTKDCVKALRAHEVDALMHNSYVWSYILQKPSYSNLTVHPATMFSMDFKVGALNTKKGREIIGNLNEGIKSLNDTKRQAVILDYTSRRLYRNDFFDDLYEYRIFLIVASLIFAMLIIIYTTHMILTKRKQRERERELIETDSLTGVLSMDGFRKRVEELLRTYPDNQYLLSFNNIKNFKYINESMGRKTGDELLRFWMKKSLSICSEEEAIGRITGDRFAVFRKITNSDLNASYEKEVYEPVRNYFLDRGKDIMLQICSGIYVLTPQDYHDIDVDRMLDYARIAEKKVRSSMKSGYEFYNPEQWEKGKLIADISGNLSVAVKTGEIQVWYQPQIDYESGMITGAEAQCRWNHSKLGWISPGVFIPILEEAGLIFDLDSFVWDKVCQDLQRWNLDGKRRSISVNLSRSDISEETDIAEHFSGLIKKYGLDAGQLRIEITETSYVQNPDLLIKTTSELRKRGFLVEMDDFGSGYSSLNMLKEVPVDIIKLDLNFFTESGDPEKSKIIITEIIRMINMLGIKLIAEGVERLEQAEFLKEQGCREMQGFYFYKPIPVEEFEALESESRQ